VSNVYIEVTDQSFAQQVEQSDKPVVVDFWAPWCGPCRIIAPTFEELAREYQDRVVFAKLNTDNSLTVASRLGIRSIPTLVFFRDGREMSRVIGVRPREDLKARIESLLKTAA
jgi:thioredoxin 1